MKVKIYWVEMKMKVEMNLMFDNKSWNEMKVELNMIMKVELILTGSESWNEHKNESWT